MTRLKTILGANALSCLAFGGVFIAAPASVAAFLGTPPAPAWLIAGLGAGLILNGLHLAYAATRTAPSRAAVAYFSAGDFLWVVATLVLVATGTWITAPRGIAAALAVAVVVAALGILQLRRRPQAAAAQ